LAHYGNEDSVRTWLKAFDDDEQLSPEIVEEALTSADDFINSKIDEQSVPSITPRALVSAANYWAKMEILDAFYNTEEDRSPTAITYEEKARERLDQYIKENPAQIEEKRYSGCHTPSDYHFRKSSSGYVDPDRW
jgi:hypothetical protein